MSEDKIETKKKDKSTLKALGIAALGVVGLATTIAKAFNGNKE